MTPGVVTTGACGVLVLDADGRIEAADAGACALLGRSEARLIGTTLESTVHPDDVSAAERRVLREDGTLVLVSAHTVAVPASGVQLVLLEDAGALVRRAQRVCAHVAGGYVGEVTSYLAHDVRNAFAGIGGAVEVLALQMPADSPQRTAIEHVRDRMRDLDRTMEDVLAFARRATLRPRPISVRAALARAGRALAARDLALEVTGHDDVLVHADPEVVASAVGLAVWSLARHGAKGARVELASTGEHAVLSLDAGLPIAASVRMTAPDLESADRLGLAVARRLVELSAGELSIAGEAVRVLLPRAA